MTGVSVHVKRKRFNPKTMSVVEELVEVPGVVVEVPDDVFDAIAAPEAPTTDLPDVPESPAEAVTVDAEPKPKRRRRKKAAKKNTDA